MSAASSRGVVDSVDRAAVVEQIRLGVHAIGSIVQSSVAADTLLVDPLGPAAFRKPARRHGFLRLTGVISAVASLAGLVTTWSGASPHAGRALAYAGGAAAGVGGVFDRLTASPPTTPETDDATRMIAIDLETELRESVHETERTAEWLWLELRGMALDSCATDAQVTWLARRYTSALHEASMIVDLRVVRSAAIARSAAECPGFATESRRRCDVLASHLDAVAELWHERRWLIERSKQNALDYLVLADRP
jgi:hypothetical protein